MGIVARTRKSGILAGFAVSVLLCGTAANAQDTAEAHFRRGGELGDEAMHASIFKRMSLAKEAHEEFERAVQIDPNFMPARFALIEYDMRAPSIIGGGEDKAIAEANEIRKRDAVDGHRAFAMIYAIQKKTDLARKEYADAVKEQPNSPKAHYWLGVSHLGDNNFSAAGAEFETSIKLDPDYMPGWFQVGHVAALTGTNLDRGEAALRKYLGYTPKHNEPAIYRTHYWLGTIYEKQGKKADAKASYATSLKARPDQKDVQEAMKRVS